MIKATYLMWLGTDCYPTVDSWFDEANELGVSKRLPNMGTAAKLLQEGVAVFVAHDEGERKNCSHCTVERKCGNCGGTGWTGPAELFHPGRKRCEECDERGMIQETTGGSVVVDGTRITWREYISRKRTKAWEKDEDHTVAFPLRCEHCGGLGKLPVAKIHGMFLPKGADYILKADDKDALLQEVTRRGIHHVPAEVLHAESYRKCGRRVPGGFYVVTEARDEVVDVDTHAVLEELVERGMVEPEAVEVRGGVYRFLRPVEIEAKRFRGIKRWDAEGKAEDEAQMIMEAVMG